MASRGLGRRSDSRWPCSTGRRRAGPAPPGGIAESCPGTGHLGTEAYDSGHWRWLPCYFSLQEGGSLLPGRWPQGWRLHCRFLGGRRCGGQRPLRVWLDIIRHCTSLVWVPPWQEREHWRDTPTTASDLRSGPQLQCWTTEAFLQDLFPWGSSLDRARRLALTGPQGVTNQRSRQSWPWHGRTAEGLGRWEQLLGVVMLNSVPRLDTQTRSLRCVPEPQSEEHCGGGRQEEM